MAPWFCRSKVVFRMTYDQGAGVVVAGKERIKVFEAGNTSFRTWELMCSSLGVKVFVAGRQGFPR